MVAFDGRIACRACFSRANTRIVALALTLVSCFELATGEPVKPAALVAAERAREKTLLRTARLEFSERCTSSGGPTTGGSSRVHYYTWQCAGDAYVTVDQGDEEGVVMRDGDGRPRDDLPYHGPMHFLAKNDELWLHVEDSPSADVFAGSRERTDFFRLHDLRRLGLDPVVFGRDLEEENQRLGRPPLDYQSSLEDGLQVVTASTFNGYCRWWIDSEKGWNVVRTGVWLDGVQIGETRFILEQVDGVWFPQRIDRYRLAAGDTEPSSVITVLSAEFNRPEHPQELTPPDIGVEPGTNLMYQDRDDAGPAIWDGQAAISPDEYRVRLKNGSLKRGPTVERALARALQAEPRDAQPTSRPTGEGGGTATRPALFFAGERGKTFESQWEAYTRRFIMRYRLNAEQGRKAWQICRNCEALGRSSIEKRRADFDEWQKRKDALASASADEQKKQREALDLRRKELMAPVERIFEERLKPELDKIPTAQQRETHRETAK